MSSNTTEGFDAWVVVGMDSLGNWSSNSLPTKFNFLLVLLANSLYLWDFFYCGSTCFFRSWDSVISDGWAGIYCVGFTACSLAKIAACSFFYLTFLASRAACFFFCFNLAYSSLFTSANWGCPATTQIPENFSNSPFQSWISWILVEGNGSWQ